MQYPCMNDTDNPLHEIANCCHGDPGNSLQRNKKSHGPFNALVAASTGFFCLL